MSRTRGSDGPTRDGDRSRSPREGAAQPQTFGSVDATTWSRRLIPNWLRHWAIAVDVSSPQSAYPAGTDVPFVVTMKNVLPIPITVGVRSPIPWTWDVDGHVEASRVGGRYPPEQLTAFDFTRGERKQFRKRWDGMFKIADDEWERADPGEYTIGAGINVDDAAGKGLYDETTVRILPE